MWELWDSDVGDPTMDSRNHIYSASITTFLTKHLAGIDGLAAGFDSAIVAPINIPLQAGWAGGLISLDAAVGTPHGAISSSWALLVPGAGGDTASCGVQAEGSATHCSIAPLPPPGCQSVKVGCAPGAVITAVPFASFGTIGGACPKSLAIGGCHSGPNVTAYVVSKRGWHSLSLSLARARFLLSLFSLSSLSLSLSLPPVPLRPLGPAVVQARFSLRGAPCGLNRTVAASLHRLHNIVCPRETQNCTATVTF